MIILYSLTAVVNNRVIAVIMLSLQTGVVERGDSHQFGLHTVAHVELSDEFMDGLLGHLLIGAGERLERQIGRAHV